MKRVALYLRVSTLEQNPDTQLHDLRQLAAQRGWEIVEEYIDYESGSKSERPEFQRMLADASKRKFDLVLFWALDRLSREGVLPTLQYLNQLESYGVGFRSFTEPYFDSCGIFKDAVIGIMATLAKQERIRRAERTRAGLAIARARGKVLGRPRTITVRSTDVARLRAAGHSFRRIGRQLGISLRSVQRLAV